LRRNFRKTELVNENSVFVGGNAVGSGFAVRGVRGSGGLVQVGGVIILKSKKKVFVS
jgi:hypothetical protein